MVAAAAAATAAEQRDWQQVPGLLAVGLGQAGRVSACQRGHQCYRKASPALTEIQRVLLPPGCFLNFQPELLLADLPLPRTEACRTGCFPVQKGLPGRMSAGTRLTAPNCLSQMGLRLLDKLSGQTVCGLTGLAGAGLGRGWVFRKAAAEHLHWRVQRQQPSRRMLGQGSPQREQQVGARRSLLLRVVWPRAVRG